MTEDKMLCPRCGEEMKLNSRYCMKCGYLNYNHPDNANLKSHMGKLQDTTAYVNGVAQIKEFEGVKKNHELRFGSNTGNKKICFLVNISLYIIVLLITFLFYFSKCDKFIDVIYTTMPFIYILISLIFMYLYAIELIFMKMNERWWVAFVPIYNLFVLSYRGMENYLYGIIALIPGVNIIYFFILAYKIGIKFGFNGIIFMLFWPIFIPMCGFSDNTFDGVTYVAGLEACALEKEFKLKNTFIVIASTILVVCLVLVGYLNRGLLKNPMESLNKYYYVYASKAIVRNVKNDIKLRTINCDLGVYVEENDGDYYFHYSSVNETVGLLFGSSRDEIEAYVKVVNKNGISKYYVTLSDGVYGILEKELSEIGINDVVKLDKISEIYKTGNNCRVKK